MDTLGRVREIHSQDVSYLPDVFRCPMVLHCIMLVALYNLYVCIYIYIIFFKYIYICMFISYTRSCAYIRISKKYLHSKSSWILIANMSRMLNPITSPQKMKLNQHTNASAQVQVECSVCRACSIEDWGVT